MVDLGRFTSRMKKMVNESVKYKRYEHELDMKNISYPVQIRDIEKFEKQNNISVNVFGYENDKVFPMYMTKIANGRKEVELLYIENDVTSHYCWIKNFSRLMRSQTNFSTKRFYCHRCLHGFTTKELLDQHTPSCEQFKFQRVTYPSEEGNVLQFKDYHKCMKVGFVIYADFESYIQKIDTCLPNPNSSSSTNTSKHVACGFSYVVVCTNKKFSKPVRVFRGCANVVDTFLKCLAEEEEYIREKYQDIEPLIMSKEAECHFAKQTHCYVCNKKFTNETGKTRDHAHLNVSEPDDSTRDYASPHDFSSQINSSFTNYRGASCNRCNLMMRPPSFVPVIFHNLKGYDSHLLLSEATVLGDKKIQVIASSMEKYTSFSIGNLRFLDSFQFLSSSLDTLIENLKSEGGSKYFHQFKKAFPRESDLDVLLQKNEYCYDYIDCPEKFEETELPTREAFFNKLTDEAISEEKYAHAQKIWRTFQLRNVGEFHDLYVKCDVLALADVFEHFRNMAMKYYQLDPCHFYTSPGLAWQAALKMTGISLELLTDPLKFSMFELGTRGGVSVVSQKYSKANNKYLDDYDSDVPSSYCLYTDATNLYGWAMQEPLPTGLMRFLDEDEIERFDVSKQKETGDVGYLCEVDLEYPESLHDQHNCYPLAPTHKTVRKEELSPFSQSQWEGTIKGNIECSKLVPTLENKKNYICHHRVLAYYVQKGMIIRKKHRILKYHQSTWLKKYIAFNSEMRKHAKNDFEKDFFKLMCNR